MTPPVGAPRAATVARRGDESEAVYEVSITDSYGSVDGFDVTITDQQFTGDGTVNGFDVTITDQQFTG